MALTHLNDTLLGRYAITPFEEFTVDGADKTRVHSFLLKPPDFSPSRKYPVLLLIHAGRLPWLALLIPARDLVTLIGTPLVMGRGYEFQVNFLGKVATWLLYASLGFIMVTHEGTQWPLWIFWTGLALAFVSLGEYVLKARREVLA